MHVYSLRPCSNCSKFCSIDISHGKVSGKWSFANLCMVEAMVCSLHASRYFSNVGLPLNVPCKLTVVLDLRNNYQQVGVMLAPSCNIGVLEMWVQRTATHCNTLQHTAIHCNTLQHTATRCNTPASRGDICTRMRHWCAGFLLATHWQHTVAHCNTQELTATHCSTLQHTGTHCNTQEFTATHRNSLQHTSRQ